MIDGFELLRPQHFFGGGERADAAIFEKQKRARKARGRQKVVHDGETHGARFGGVAARRLHHDQLVAQVERARGLVQKQYFGPGDEGLRHEDELFLSAREPADGLLREVRDFHAVQRPVHLFKTLGRDAPGEVVHESQKHHFEDRESARHGGELRNVAHALSRAFAPVLHDEDGPLVSDEARDGLQKRGLAAAVLSDHARDGAARASRSVRMRFGPKETERFLSSRLIIARLPFPAEGVKRGRERPRAT